MISVIISTYNSEKYIGECLKAVLDSGRVEFEVIVVDAGSTKISNIKYQISKIQIKNQKYLKIIFLDENVGLTVSNNAGAKIARGEYLLFLDVDTKIDKKALFEIVKFFEKNSEAGAVQGNLVDRYGRVETMGHFLSWAGFPWERADFCRATSGESNCRPSPLLGTLFATPEEALPIFGARGACLGIRREVFEKVGGFDEDFFMHNEETDLSWRVWLAGYRIYYLPRAVVRHYGKSHYVSATSGESDRRFALSAAPEESYRRVFYEGAKNQITMIIKNADLGVVWWVLPLNVLGWIIVGLVAFGRTHRSAPTWVFRGIGRAFLNLKKTIMKRKKVFRKKGNEARKVMFGDINFISLMQKGFKWLRSL